MILMQHLFTNYTFSTVRDWTFPELSSGAVYTRVAVGHFTGVSKHTQLPKPRTQRCVAQTYLQCSSQLSTHLNTLSTKVFTYHAWFYTHTILIFTYLQQTLSVPFTHPFGVDRFQTSWPNFQMPSLSLPDCGLPLPQDCLLCIFPSGLKCQELYPSEAAFHKWPLGVVRYLPQQLLPFNKCEGPFQHSLSESQGEFSSRCLWWQFA